MADGRSVCPRCDRTTVCVLDRGHRGPCERPGGVRVVTTSDVEHSQSETSRVAVDYYWPGTMAGDRLPVRGTAFYDAATPLEAWDMHERRLLSAHGRYGLGPAEEIVLRACVAEDRGDLRTIESIIRAERLR